MKIIGKMLQNTTYYNSIESHRKQLQQQQEQQDRKLAQFHQEEEDREFAQQQQAKYNRNKFQQQQQQQREQDKKIPQMLALNDRVNILKTDARLQTPGKVIVQLGQVTRQSPNEYYHSYGFGGIPDPASQFPQIAVLRDTYDQDYVHGDRATRNRYAQTYAAIASAHPNILPLPSYGGDNDSPCEVPHPRFW